MPNQKSSRPPPGPRNALEEAFFRAEDQRLIHAFRELEKARESRRLLAEVSGIKNDEVLTKLVSLAITPQTLAALGAFPLIEVAWADGNVDADERRAILERLRDAGIPSGSTEERLVERWLEQRPGPALLEAWMEYVRGLCEQMTETERVAFRDEVIGRARAVANASGGVAGLWKTSRSEREALERLEAAFG